VLAAEPAAVAGGDATLPNALDVGSGAVDAD
jgi:hypothetical protein